MCEEHSDMVEETEIIETPEQVSHGEINLGQGVKYQSKEIDTGMDLSPVLKQLSKKEPEFSEGKVSF